jgi:hypothetical protein
VGCTVEHRDLTQPSPDVEPGREEQHHGGGPPAHDSERALWRLIWVLGSPFASWAVAHQSSNELAHGGGTTHGPIGLGNHGVREHQLVLCSPFGENAV